MSSEQPSSCPSCGTIYGDGFEQDYSLSNFTCVVYGNPTTFGQQAELNAKRLGKEQMQLIQDKNNKRLEEKPLNLKNIKSIERYIETGDKQ
jgi:hypothetical protein